MPVNLSFDNLENAFASKSNADLNRSYLLFKAIASNSLVSMMEPLTAFGLKVGLPVKAILKATIFKHFVGGENINECESTMDKLHKYGVGSILDYSVEGSEDEAFHEATAQEIIRTIHKAKNNPKIPFTVFKPTGLITFSLLEKVSAGALLTDNEHREWLNCTERIERVCRTAYENNVKIFMDAEDTWIQKAIDFLAAQMMEKFNKEKVTVYNTIQLYRTDRLEHLKQAYKDACDKNYILGEKLVRGAYMEKERERAAKMNYPDPIQPDKAASDKAYDEAIRFCVDHIDRIAICAGTHNENSSYLLANLMEEKHIDKKHPHIWFSQLLGMSDHISFNLAVAGYNVCKYVPYGPVKSVMPYLFRRAKENTSVKGQTGRELSLILKETLWKDSN